MSQVLHFEKTAHLALIAGGVDPQAAFLHFVDELEKIAAPGLLANLAQRARMAVGAMPSVASRLAGRGAGEAPGAAMQNRLYAATGASRPGAVQVASRAAAPSARQPGFMASQGGGAAPGPAGRDRLYAATGRRKPEAPMHSSPAQAPQPATSYTGSPQEIAGQRLKQQASAPATPPVQRAAPTPPAAAPTTAASAQTPPPVQPQAVAAAPEAAQAASTEGFAQRHFGVDPQGGMGQFQGGMGNWFDNLDPVKRQKVMALMAAGVGGTGLAAGMAAGQGMSGNTTVYA